MRVLNLFNMAQDAYHVTKAMRSMGIDADLLVLETGDNTVSSPEWEESGATKNQWVKTVRKGGFFKGRVKTLMLMRGYDIIFCHAHSSLYANLLRSTYVPYDAGLIRYLPHPRQLPAYRGGTFYMQAKLHLLLRSYKEAKRILFTNPDTMPLFKLAGIQESKLRFVPFIIDSERYRPKKTEETHDGLVFFSPTRQVWSEKGNEKLLHAYARYEKEYDDTMLILSGWGPDFDASKKLVETLQIRSAKFVPPMKKSELITKYQQSDVVFDQFVLGSYGTTCPEAMSCGVPVVMYLSHWHEDCYGETAPVANAHEPKQIYEAMVRLRDPSQREVLQRLGREYVLRHHSAEEVVNRHMQVAQEVLEGK